MPHPRPLSAPPAIDRADPEGATAARRCSNRDRWGPHAVADCAADGVWEFFPTAAPLPVTGAVGAPVNPLAVK